MAGRIPKRFGTSFLIQRRSIRSLKNYLGAWFPILGSKIPRIVYIDGFCGPGRYTGGEDGSPIIALKEAIKQPVLASSEVTFLFIDDRNDKLSI